MASLDERDEVYVPTDLEDNSAQHYLNISMVLDVNRDDETNPDTIGALSERNVNVSICSLAVTETRRPPGVQNVGNAELLDGRALAYLDLYDSEEDDQPQDSLDDMDPNTIPVSFEDPSDPTEGAHMPTHDLLQQYTSGVPNSGILAGSAKNYYSKVRSRPIFCMPSPTLLPIDTGTECSFLRR